MDLKIRKDTLTDLTSNPTVKRGKEMAIITTSLPTPAMLTFILLLLLKGVISKKQFKKLLKKLFRRFKKKPEILVILSNKYLQEISCILQQLVEIFSQIEITTILNYILKTAVYRVIFELYWFLILDSLFVLLRPDETGSGYEKIILQTEINWQKVIDEQASIFFFFFQFLESLQQFMKNQSIRNHCYWFIVDYLYLVLWNTILFRCLKVPLYLMFKIFFLYINNIKYSILQFSNLA